MEPKTGYTRLYRVESTTRGAISDWNRITQQLNGHDEAKGRWFVAEPAMLDWYREDAAGPTRTLYVDVPTIDLERYRVSNSTEQIGHRSVKSYSKDPENEFFLPRNLAGRAWELGLERPLFMDDLRAEAKEIEGQRGMEQDRGGRGR